MWEKWTKFCEWNIQDAHDHPKKRAVIVTASLVGCVAMFHGIAYMAMKDHESYMRSRGVNVD